MTEAERKELIVNRLRELAGIVAEGVEFNREVAAGILTDAADLLGEQS